MANQYLEMEGTRKNPTCICGKVGFSKIDAQTKANFLKRQGKAKNMRVYQCLESDNWHITSKNKWEY